MVKLRLKRCGRKNVRLEGHDRLWILLSIIFHSNENALGST